MSTHSRAWTPGRIASVSVLTIAVGALVVDKAFLGHSEPTAASADLLVDAAGSNHGVASVMPPESLAHRLEQHRAQATTPAGRAFVAPAGFLPQPVATLNPSDNAESAPVSVVQIAWPRLSAVVTGTSPGAILDGHLVRLGEMAGNIELISVSERSVTVRQGDHEAVLTLE